jgi:gephyrin
VTYADLWYNVVSDTAAIDATADQSGPTIQQILQEHGFDCRSPIIVPDDETRIQSFVKDCSERGNVDWIITTGGTGFGVRDKTPEVKIDLSISCQHF